MNYRVRYQPRVVEAIDRQVEYLLSQQVAPAQINAWLGELYDLVDSLAQWPRRYPIAEGATGELGTEIRRIVFGNYLIFFHIDEKRQCINVVHFRHAAQETNRLTDDDA